VAQSSALAKAVGAAVLVALVACAAVGIRWCDQHSRGIELRLHNAEKSRLRAVTVTVVGNSYTVGDLAPDATGSIWAEPTSDSDVEVSFTTATGEVKHLPVPHSYIEPGNSGWMSVDLTTDNARNVERHIKLY
jgi:hypothetical protein